jgi:hypothetical protein
MNELAVALLVVAGGMLLVLPRRLAPIPLLVGTCYMTLAQGIEVGPFSFPFFRLVVLIGLVRVALRGERPFGGFNRLDGTMVLFAAVALLTSAFHQDPHGQFVFCLGLIFNTSGIYFLLRALVHSTDDVIALSRTTAFLLLPVAAEMLLEVLTERNYFAVLGGVPEVPEIREGRLRAQGPFAHSILAGTVGAAVFPVMAGLWQRQRVAAIVGALSTLTMVVTSSSSGPMASMIVAVMALAMWKRRHAMRSVRWLAVVGYVVLDLVMKAPPYFLLARIDLAGGSTGWHRAELIDSALRHLDEWWLWGTDYTRHWMPSGVSWSPDHTDITNHYLQMGVIGGLPLMLAFIMKLVNGFSFVGQIVRRTELAHADRLTMWTLGAALFAHVATSISVSYFDQSILFIYLNLAMIGSMWSSLARIETDAPPATIQHEQASALPRPRPSHLERLHGERRVSPGLLPAVPER